MHHIYSATNDAFALADALMPGAWPGSAGSSFHLHDLSLGARFQASIPKTQELVSKCSMGGITIPECSPLIPSIFVESKLQSPRC